MRKRILIKKAFCLIVFIFTIIFSLTTPRTSIGSEGSPKLVISKENNAPQGVTAGEIVKYAVAIKNEGDAVARDVILVDTLPAGFTYKSGSGKLNNHTMSDPGGNNPYTWGLGELPEREEFKLEYEVEISTNVESGVYKNTAQVSGKIAHSEVEIVEKILATATVKEELPATGAEGDKRILALVAILLASASLLLRYYVGDFTKLKKS